MTFNENNDLMTFLLVSDDLYDAIEAERFYMDADDERDEAPEDKRFVSYQDVADPEAGVVWGYGGDHRVYIPGAHE